MATRSDDELADRLSSVLGGAKVGSLVRLSGGASRETWSFTADGRALILQRQRDGAARGMASEAE
ncbi:MAG: phosphotransferase family protein, partial [Actinomycetota bacterium]